MDGYGGLEGLKGNPGLVVIKCVFFCVKAISPSKIDV